MYKHRRSTHLGALRVVILLASIHIVSLFTFAALAFIPQQVAAAPLAGCSTGGPPSGDYTLTFCIVLSSTANLQGSVPVTATVDVTLNKGSQPGFQKVIYTLSNRYLLTDFNLPPSTFRLPTSHFVDGSRTIKGEILMGDGYTQTASLGLSFQNGVTQAPPIPNSFQPSTGTAPAAGQPFVIAAIGDGAGGESNASEVSNLIAAQNPNMFLYLGDVYEEGSYPEFTNWYGRTSFFGRFKSITNPTPGNHEYLSTEGTGTATIDAPGYRYYWGIPTTTPTYYSLDVAGWHIVSLNTNCSDVGTCNVGSEQYNWLSSDLSSSPACILAMYHEPLFDLGQQGITPPTVGDLWSLLASKGTALVLNGHSHTYQRWTPLDGDGNPNVRGVTEIVAGAGGHSVEAFVKTDSRVLVAYDRSSSSVVYGTLVIKLYSNYATLQYINTLGQTLDSGAVECGGGLRSNPLIPRLFLPLVIR